VSICPHHRVIFSVCLFLSYSLFLHHSLSFSFSLFFYPRTAPHYTTNVGGPSGAMAAATAVVGRRRHSSIRAFRRAKWPTDSHTYARTNSNTYTIYTASVRLSTTTPTRPYLHVNISGSRIFPLLLFFY